MNSNFHRFEVLMTQTCSDMSNDFVQSRPIIKSNNNKTLHERIKWAVTYRWGANGKKRELERERERDRERER